MIPRMYIEGTKCLERPDSRRTVFADGTADATFRTAVDLELSHWIPNRTPVALKADTSTEICMNFVASGDADYELVVNNHADVDGVLSVFTLLHPATALAHRETIVSAAEMGDFWGWGELPAQVLFQSLTEQIDTLTGASADPQVVFERCLAHLNGLIDEGFADPDIEGTLTPLTRSVDWVKDGTIQRTEHHGRFVHYTVPKHLADEALESALRVPKFNAMITDDLLFWPQARARWDREKVQLVSIESTNGWYYDLWYPAYLWAETPKSWRAPGLHFTANSSYTLSYEPLKAAARDLEKRELHHGVWGVETDFSLLSSALGRGYPVVLSFMNGMSPTPSSLEPPAVAPRLAEVFAHL
jgi:hypothetical protein